MNKREKLKSLRDNGIIEKAQKAANRHLKPLGLKMGKLHIINEEDDDADCHSTPFGCRDKNGKKCGPC